MLLSIALILLLGLLFGSLFSKAKNRKQLFENEMYFSGRIKGVSKSKNRIFLFHKNEPLKGDSEY